MKNVKKIIVMSVLTLSIITGSMLTGGVQAKASQSEKPSIEKRVKQLELQNKYYNQLKKQGFPADTIKFLAPEEIEFIIENNSVYRGETTKHTLYIHTENEPEELETITTELSEEEFELYNFNKEKLINQKINQLKDKFPHLEKYNKTANDKSDSTNGLLAATTMAMNPTTTSMDTSVLTLKVNNYDTYTSGYYKRTIGEEFEWSSDPFWIYTDAIGFSVSGSWWATYGSGGYYYNGHAFYDLEEMKCNTKGVCAKIDITASYDGKTNYGRIYATMGNTSQNVPKNMDYTVYADYAHTVFGYTGMNVGVGLTGISVDPTVGTFIIDANQVLQVYTTPAF